MDRIGGWNVPASGTHVPLTAAKTAQAGKQHVIYAVQATFSTAPAAGVLCQIVDPDVSPNLVLWDGYLGGSTTPPEKTFPAGLCAPMGHSVVAELADPGSGVTAKLSLHGNTR